MKLQKKTQSMHRYTLRQIYEINQHSRESKFHSPMKLTSHKNRHKPSHHLRLQHIHTFTNFPI